MEEQKEKMECLHLGWYGEGGVMICRRCGAVRLPSNAEEADPAGKTRRVLEDGDGAVGGRELSAHGAECEDVENAWADTADVDALRIRHDGLDGDV